MGPAPGWVSHSSLARRVLPRLRGAVGVRTDTGQRTRFASSRFSPLPSPHPFPPSPLSPPLAVFSPLWQARSIHCHLATPTLLPRHHPPAPVSFFLPAFRFSSAPCYLRFLWVAVSVFSLPRSSPMSVKKSHSRWPPGPRSGNSLYLR